MSARLIAPDLWSSIFGNSNSVELEIGPGTGAFLLWAAERNPQINYYAIERAWRRYRHLDNLLAQRRLPNVVLLSGDASCVMRNILPPSCVSAYHIYFPDPWWKRKHFGRRIFTPDFAADLSRTLATDGVVYFATDVELVFNLACKALVDTKLFRIDPELRSPRSVQTLFERKGLARGSRIHHAVFVPIR